MLFGVQLWGVQIFWRKVEIALSMGCHSQTPEVEVVISLWGALQLYDKNLDVFPIPERCGCPGSRQIAPCFLFVLLFMAIHWWMLQRVKLLRSMDFTCKTDFKTGFVQIR